MRTYWVPGVNILARYGRWAIIEFTAVYEIEAEFNKLIAAQCERIAADVVDHEV